MRTFAIAAGLSLLGVPAIAATVTVANAAKHVGENVIVEGIVASVYAAPNGMILLDLGGRHPDNKFVAVIFPKDTAGFGRVSGYVGNRVQISGTVQIYHGKPEITLTDEGQIQVIAPGRGQKLTT